MRENNFDLETNLDYISYGETKNPKHLVIFLHGYGSNKENLITLAHHFFDCLPDSLFISPDAPLSLADDFPDGNFLTMVINGFQLQLILAIKLLNHHLKDQRQK